MREILGDINSNNQLTKLDKLWYLLYNLGRGIWGHLTYFKTSYWTWIEYRESSDSPGRRYLDSFILHKLPQILSKREINILDVGCGGGYLREILSSASFKGAYTGIDAVRSPRYMDNGPEAFTSRFIETKIEDYRSQEPYDLVISNTALEHVEDDFTAVRRCWELAGDRGVQIHIVPAFWSLFAYLWHGYPQYNPRRIKKLFEGQSYVVYRLGGLGSLILHAFMITVPERIFGFRSLRQTKFYSRAAFNAQKFDSWLPFCSLMYIVIVQKND